MTFSEDIYGPFNKEFKTIFDSYHKGLCVFALKYVDSVDIAEDIVQEVFLNLWDLKMRGSKILSNKSYLFKSVKNNALKYLEKSGRYVFDDIEDHAEKLIEINPESDNSEILKKINQELEKLSPQSKRIFELIVLEDKRYKEVAEELGISVNTVKTQLSRAMKKLRGSLDIVVLLLLP